MSDGSVEKTQKLPV